MFKRILPALCVLCLVLYGCRKPKPLDISIPQSKPSLVGASACPGDRAIYISIGYSISSMVKLEDSTVHPDLLRSIMMDSGRVTISGDNIPERALVKMTTGVYALPDVPLLAGTSYTVRITDHKKGVSTQATTTYMPMPDVATMVVEKKKKGADTLVQLKLSLRNVNKGDHYYVTYNTQQKYKKSSQAGAMSSLYTFEAKKVILYTGDEAKNGTLDKYIKLNVSATDTIRVEVAKIDRGYYKYLDAYIRTGYLVNQVTGEPINLPTNFVNGYGYFTLCRPHAILQDMNTTPVSE